MTDQVKCILFEPTSNAGTPTASQIGQIFYTRNNVLPVSRAVLAEDNWEFWPSPISAQLGVPLKFMQYKEPSLNGFTGWNFSAQVFSTDHDPASSSFGVWTGKPIYGPVLAVHCEAKDLDSELVFNVLIDYINDNFSKDAQVIAALPEGDGKEVAKRQILLKLSKEAFNAHFEEVRRLRISAGITSWEELKSPVLLKYSEVAPACGGCGALTSSNGGTLGMCGKCKLRSYCSRECQQKDWKTHKKACDVRA